MPAREPSYFRWAEDKPCTTNQTYGYELRHEVGRRNNDATTCKLCAAEAAAAAAATARQQARQTQRQMAANRRDTPGCCPHSQLHCKPINKGYTMGPVSMTKRLQASSCCGSRRQKTAGAGGVSSGGDDQQSSGKDLYLWHALAGTIVHCKNDETACE